MQNKNLDKAIIFISKNFKIAIQLNDIAQAANTSVFYFQKSFTKAFNESPTQYLNRIRLEYAAHLLALFPEGSLTQVAYECGFSSPTVFSRSFSNKYKVSPSLFQKKYQGKKSHANKSDEKETKKVRFAFEKEKSSGYEIKYLPSTTLRILKLTEPFSKSISHTIETNTKFKQFTNVYLEAPFHPHPQKHRMLICVYDDTAKTSDANCYEISSGYYATLKLKGGVKEMWNTVLAFKTKWLDFTPYKIKEPVCFEIFTHNHREDKFDFLKTERTLFVPLAK